MRRVKNIFILALILFVSAQSRAATTNLLVWQGAGGRVTADIHGEPLWPLLETIAHQTGWRVFVEPGTDRKTDVKFRDLPSRAALKKLLGDLNYAFVPQTNGADFLYIFRTTMSAATQAVMVAPAKSRHVSNQLLVKLKPGADIEALAKKYGAKIIGRDDKLHIYLLQFDNADATDAALAELKNDSDVEAVDYNYIFDQPVASQMVANAPQPPVSLSPKSSDQNDPCDPIVATLDTRYQPSGSAIDQFVLKQISVVNNGGSSGTASGSTQTQSIGSPESLSPQQISGTAGGNVPTHGTSMVQTILRAVSQVSDGSSSVRILPVDVYGDGETTTTWNVALGVQAAVNHGATVINMSLGGGSDSAILDGIIQQARAQGIVFFASAGNTPTTSPTFPAAYEGVNAVTALGAPGQLASYANYGSFVEMALPGASYVYLGNQAYIVQGTSPAAAYASGIAAGTKTVNCAGWPQIVSAMTQKFPVPQK